MNEQILRQFAELIGRILARRWLRQDELGEGNPPTPQIPLPGKDQSAKQQSIESQQPQ
jgi:hypothetical protein